MLPDGAVCAATTFEADAEPIDLFVMFDQSTSMNNPLPGGGTIWTVVVDAFKLFLDDQQSAGIRVGIQYFGLPGVPSGVSCNPADYAVPEVPIAELPGVADQIKASLDAHGPSSFTPTGPALQGALDYARSHAASNPDRLTAVLLATDGYPASPEPRCMPEQLSDIRDLAKAAAEGTPKILTFVIGVGGLSNLNGIAEAGGTGEAFIIDSTAGDVGQQFAQAMRSIASTPLSCKYDVPMPEDGGILQPNLVNVNYTPPGAPTKTLPKVESPSGCMPGVLAWFYTPNNTEPTEIHLCPGTCDQLGAGTLDILLGCTTYTGPM
jgi:hypothetical protein